MVKIVFFDVGGTLIDVDYELLAALGAPQRSAARLRSAEPDLRLRMNEHLAEAGRFTETQGTFRLMIASLWEITGASIEESSFEQIAVENARRSVWRAPNPDAIGVVEAMRRSGRRAGVVSNSNGTVAKLLTECGFLGFAPVIDSGIVGVAKPDPAIFRIALTAARVDAGDAVYVGDIPSVDVVGARAAGITPILYDRAGVYRDYCEAEAVTSIRSMAELTDAIS